ncbi:MAG: glycosyltransferase family 4 protein [Actinomycetia bacterium]|nr:glycosyltransferase family 4 protein [Actinomycetes bacterium]MCP4961842.1 glycosyltransferase family 4 protein [Actinomycetes bacterium]
MNNKRPLRIALLTYRGHPYTGGQGVYVRHLARELKSLGHHVTVVSGPPYPILDEGIELVELPSLDLYRMPDPFRFPKFSEYDDWIDVLEYAITAFATFAEPLTFSLRAARYLKHRLDDFDLVHDNQCLGYGILQIQDMGMPVLETIHHPITVDRRIETEHAPTRWKRLTKDRFYAFTTMQSHVAQRLPRVVTVSSNSYDDIVTGHGVDPNRLHIVHVGVDPDHFKPIPGIEPVPGRIMTTASADVAMKGLAFLLEALAKLRVDMPEAHLTIIGRPKYDSRATRTITELGLGDHIEFVSGVSDDRIVELYSEAQVAVVPSLYEGFSLPAIEAMSCGVPLVASTGGALPEVVGADGETAIHVEPGNTEDLVAKVGHVLRNPDLRSTIGQAGRQRVVDNYSWRITAERTVAEYRALLDELGTRR